jgi:hypothetical protein
LSAAPEILLAIDTVFSDGFFPSIPPAGQLVHWTVQAGICRQWTAIVSGLGERNMATVDFGFDLIREEVKLYETHSEAWKPAHRSAMRCRDLEARLAFGVFTFGQIGRADEEWRREVYAGKLPFSEEVETTIGDAYRSWARVCDSYLQAIAKLEAEGYEVEHAEEFRRCAREVRGILTNDEDFFASDELATLRDEALEAHQNGITEEIAEFNE